MQDVVETDGDLRITGLSHVPLWLENLNNAPRTTCDIWVCSMYLDVAHCSGPSC